MENVLVSHQISIEVHLWIVLCRPDQNAADRYEICLYLEENQAYNFEWNPPISPSTMHCLSLKYFGDEFTYK